MLTVESDVRDREALESAVNATLVRFGRLDAVVAAAGVVVGGLPQWETPDEHLQTLMDVNVMGVWNTAAVTLPVHARRARLPASAASSPWRRPPASAGSSSSPATSRASTPSSASSGGSPPTWSAPAWLRSRWPPAPRTRPMLAATADLYDTTPNELAGQQGIRRLIAPEEIAATIALCCSPAGAALNGSVIRADGGFGG